MTKKIMIFIMVMLGFIIFPLPASADMGPKPSINVEIKNLETTNYIIDLFVYDETGKNYNVDPDFSGGYLSEEQINMLHSLNFDGWISESTRFYQYLLYSDCAGNDKHSHYFGYFGTPTRYKIVIINNDTGDIKISNEIIRKDFNSNVVIDYITMKTINNDSETSRTIYAGVLALIFTIIIELVIAYIFKIKNYKLICITNLVTNLVLQTALILSVNKYLLMFIIGELIVVAAEMIVYLLNIDNVNKKKVIIYCLVANVITLISTFLLYKL